MFRANFGRFPPTHAILLEVFLETSWPELPHAAKIKNSSHEITNIKFFENRQHEIIICLCYCWILNKLIFSFILNKKKTHLLASVGTKYDWCTVRCRFFQWRKEQGYAHFSNTSNVFRKTTQKFCRNIEKKFSAEISKQKW